MRKFKAKGNDWIKREIKTYACFHFFFPLVGLHYAFPLGQLSFVL